MFAEVPHQPGIYPALGEIPALRRFAEAIFIAHADNRLQGKAINGLEYHGTGLCPGRGAVVFHGDHNIAGQVQRMGGAIIRIQAREGGVQGGDGLGTFYGRVPLPSGRNVFTAAEQAGNGRQVAPIQVMGILVNKLLDGATGTLHRKPPHFSLRAPVWRRF